MCLGLTKPKFNFLATTKEGIFWRKKAKAVVENIYCQMLSMEVDPLCFVVNIVGVEGIMDSTKYQDILEANFWR